jgi:hypothetical protein
MNDIEIIYDLFEKQMINDKDISTILKGLVEIVTLQGEKIKKLENKNE